MDDEVVYYNVAGECPRGGVYDLGSLGRNKRRYADTGASTSQLPEMVSHSVFDTVVEQLRQVVVFMQRQFTMTMDGVGLSQPLPLPPPLPYEQQQRRKQIPLICRSNKTMLIGRCKIGLREMGSLVILRYLVPPKELLEGVRAME
ncbi:hypothetical protein Syun_025684 [Stephania yunnanensis]|uniref:Uncharacterized protein n=1 Tax=Stephania yunnanensis TaxID=152371 RepID=A0AAP0HVF1_9MAGN